MNIFILTFMHGLVPMIGIPFDPVANAAKGLLAYGFVLIKNVFNNIGIGYSLNS